MDGLTISRVDGDGSLSVNAAGQVAFVATAGDAAQPERRRGLWRGKADGGGFDLLASDGQPLPALGPDARLVGPVLVPFIDDAGAVVFMSSVKSSTAGNFTGVFIAHDGKVDLVLAETQPLAGVAGLPDGAATAPHPDRGAPF